MSDLVATTPGLFPLPAWMTDGLADHPGGRLPASDTSDEDRDADADETIAIYDRVRAEHVESQQAAGLDRVVEGQARWDDALAHPLAVHDAAETRDPIPYFDAEASYREVVVREELGFDGTVAAELEAAADLVDGSDRLQAVLPGPYSLFDLGTDEHYGDDEEFLAAVGEFLAGEAAAFPDAVGTLFLLEPSLVANPPGDGTDQRASEAIDAVAEAADAAVVVQTSRGALDEKVHAHLLDADVDAVGYDLVSDPEEAVRLVSEFGTADDVSLGVVDGTDPAVESAEVVRERVEWFEERTPPFQTFETVYVTPNTGLRSLPAESFEAKLRALGAATEFRATAA